MTTVTKGMIAIVTNNGKVLEVTFDQSIGLGEYVILSDGLEYSISEFFEGGMYVKSVF